MLVSRVLPKRLYPLLEEVVLGIVGQLTGMEDVVEDRPELFHLYGQEADAEEQKARASTTETPLEPNQSVLTRGVALFQALFNIHTVRYARDRTQCVRITVDILLSWVSARQGYTVTTCTCTKNTYCMYTHSRICKHGLLLTAYLKHSHKHDQDLPPTYHSTVPHIYIQYTYTSVLHK